MGIREVVGNSLLSAHLETSYRESPIDRVGALARASDLGRALWHLKYANDATAAPGAFKHLLRKAQRRTKVYKHHAEFELLKNVCTMVIHEWLNPQCSACGGGGEFVDEEKKLRVACQVCSGVGKKRFSDGERMAQLNIEPSIYRRWEGHIASVWTCLSSADAQAGATCRQQLEWGEATR